MRVSLILPLDPREKFSNNAGIALLASHGVDVRVTIGQFPPVGQPPYMHAKTMVVDGAVALVGSANMDLRSFRLNFEVHAVIKDDAAARALESIFDADLARSNEILLEAFKKRPVMLRVVEGAARFLSPLM